MKISKPVLLVDEAKCRENIQFMAQRAQENNLILRPHFKTHQSHEIGKWCQEYGIRNITVSSLDMANYFEGQFDHITLAIPFNVAQAADIENLASRQKMAVLVDSLSSVQYLNSEMSTSIGIWIEVDTGSKRSGVDPDDHGLIHSIVEAINSSDNHYFEGFYSHAGHTYLDRSVDAVKDTFSRAKEDILRASEPYSEKYDFKVNLGDTPGCSLTEDFSGLDSISPGNFVFYDMMQVTISSCSPDKVAVCLAAPIISKNAARNELVVYGGVHT